MNESILVLHVSLALLFLRIFLSIISIDQGHLLYFLPYFP